MTDRNTDVPRPFSFENIGKGEIIEEAAVEYDPWAPAIQLLKFDDGREMIRFCYYVDTGELAPRALSIDIDDINNLKNEVDKNHRLKLLLQRLVE